MVHLTLLLFGERWYELITQWCHWVSTCLKFSVIGIYPKEELG